VRLNLNIIKSPFINQHSTANASMNGGRTYEQENISKSISLIALALFANMASAQKPL
jgi:hypothetical protein